MRRFGSKKVVVAAVMALVVGLWLNVVDSNAADECKPIKLKASSFGSPKYVQRLIFERAMKTIEEKSNGGISFDYYPGASLLKLTQTFNALKNNIVQLAITFDGYERGRMGILSSSSILPFSWDIDKWHQRSRKPGMYYDFAEPFWNEYNIHLLAVPRVHAGALHSREPIHKLDDFKGKLLRISPGLAPAVKGLGAEPTFISLGELYSALQKGVVDGGFSSMSNYLGTKRYEVAPNLTICNFYSGTLQHAMNLETYKSLCPEWRKIFDEAFEEAEHWWAGQVDTVFKEQLAEVKAGGGNVYFVPADELARWKKASEPFWKDLQEKYPKDYPRLKELVDQIDK